MSQAMRVYPEVWPIAADEFGIWLISGAAGAWRPQLPVMADSEPHADVELELSARAVLDNVILLHSTSWRVDAPFLVVTYVAVIQRPGPVRDHWHTALRVSADTARHVGKPRTHSPIRPAGSDPGAEESLFNVLSQPGLSEFAESSWRPAFHDLRQWKAAEYGAPNVGPAYQVLVCRTAVVAVPIACQLLLVDLELAADDVNGLILAEKDAFDPAACITIKGAAVGDMARTDGSASTLTGRRRQILLFTGADPEQFVFGGQPTELSVARERVPRQLMFKDVDIAYRPNLAPIRIRMMAVAATLGIGLRRASRVTPGADARRVLRGGRWIGLGLLPCGLALSIRPDLVGAGLGTVAVTTVGLLFCVALELDFEAPKQTLSSDLARGSADGPG